MVNPLRNSNKVSGFKDEQAYDATKFSGFALLFVMTEIWGADYLAKIMGNPDTSYKSINLADIKNDTHMHGFGNLLCDQGSPECRLLQIWHAFFPGCGKSAIDHRLSNDCKNLLEPLASFVALWQNVRHFRMHSLFINRDQGGMRV